MLYLYVAVIEIGALKLFIERVALCCCYYTCRLDGQLDESRGHHGHEEEEAGGQKVQRQNRPDSQKRN